MLKLITKNMPKYFNDEVYRRHNDIRIILHLHFVTYCDIKGIPFN